MPDSNILPTRIAKSALYLVVKIFTPSSSTEEAELVASSSKSKNGKKRSHNFEGDKVFNTTAEAVFSSNAECDALLVSLDGQFFDNVIERLLKDPKFIIVLQSLYKHPNLSSSMQSIISRVIISCLISLPTIPSSSLSQDSNFIRAVNAKIQEFCFTIGSGTTNVISKTLPFLIDAVLANDRPEVRQFPPKLIGKVISVSAFQMQRTIGILLHPRVPALVRSMPHIESLSLFKAEESQEEKEAISSLGIANLHLDSTDPVGQDAIMNDLSSSGKASAPMLPIPDISVQRAGEQDQTQIVRNDSPRQPPENPPSDLHAGETPTMGGKTPLITVQNFTTFESVSNTPKSPSTHRSVFPVQMEEEGEEDEEMPSIDMDSDTEDEEQ